MYHPFLALKFNRKGYRGTHFRISYLGEVTTTFASVSDPGKVIAMIAILLGRLEVFTVLVLLTQELWKL